jgi:nucleoside-diphosphate-sugar epimerase
MRALVTGVSGFAGSYVARRMAQAGFDVVGVHRRKTQFLRLLIAEPRLALVQSDIGLVSSLPGPFDAVIHIAATSPGPDVSVEQIVRDNVTASAALIDAADKWRAQSFVFFSSLSLYGDIAVSAVDERCPITNPDAYGATKYIVELLLKERADRLPALALRLPGVLGPGAHRNWLSNVARKLLNGETIQAFHLDAAFNNAAHLADISELVLSTLTRGWKGFDAVVLGARGTTTIRGAIERLAQGIGVTARIASAQPRKTSFTLSSERAMAAWGYNPMEIGALLDHYAKDIVRHPPQ